MLLSAIVPALKKNMKNTKFKKMKHTRYLIWSITIFCFNLVQVGFGLNNKTDFIYFSCFQVLFCVFTCHSS